MKSIRLAAAVLVGMTTAGAAQGAPIHGSGTIGLTSGGSAVALNNGSDTDLFGATTLNVTNLSFTGETGEFSGVTDILGSASFSLASFVGMTVTLADGTFTAQSGGITGTSGSAAAGTETVNIFL